MNDNKIIIYQAENGAIQLRSDISAETLWATQKQIAAIFSVKIPAINKHIKNILSECELEGSTISILEIVQQEGARKVNRKVEHYNLDMLISIGYRVNSKTATKFRQWATKTLKQHILQGYTINQHLLDEKRVSAEQIIQGIQQLSKGNSQIQIDDVLELVKSFTHTWFSLQSYDEDDLPNKGQTKKPFDIQANALYTAIEQISKPKVEQLTSLRKKKPKVRCKVSSAT